MSINRRSGCVKASRPCAATRKGGLSPILGLYHGGREFVIHDGKRSVVAGFLREDGVFCKRVAEKHILRKPPAIAIQASVVQQLESIGCRELHSLLEDGTVLVVSLSEFGRKAFPLNRGFGPQLALELRYWRKPDERQLGLFCEGIDNE